ncbi:MAG: 50S ribosomal protein L5 [candidate division Zixibacteria bacterium RBG_16_40_9]|nr:MAG: 50S ribosomal protein L5 [candidate division Zixibacteria bacterium RBG_16_40_9]
MSRLKERYFKEVIPALKKKFNYKSVSQAPRLEKIVVNVGVGDAIANAKLMDSAVAELTAITAQRPAIKRAKKSISNFKLRAGMPIACMVTLRRERMYEFFDRLVSIAIPRIRDFRGISPKGFDGRGNYTLGVTEQVIFPEVNYDKIEKLRGMNITIVTTAKTDEEAQELLKALGMPFRSEN